jgi:hypothetical protein
MFMWIAEQPEKPAPLSATVIITSAASRMPRPAPPQADGIAMPSQPASANALWKSAGKALSASRLRQYSAPKRAASFFTASRIAD